MSRLLYRAQLPVFIASAREELIEAELAVSFASETGTEAGAEERTSWRRSLRALAEALDGPDLAPSSVIVELFMPLNGKRCDVLLLGRNAEGVDIAVVVELKQWSDVQPSHLFEHVSLGNRPRIHPCAQARDYAATLKDFHSAFHAGETLPRVEAIAFLHDMKPGRAANHLRDPDVFGDLTRLYPLFLGTEARAMAQWLGARLLPGPGDAFSDRIAKGRPSASPQLLSRLVQTIEGTSEWRLLDEQRTAYFLIRDAVQKAKMTGERAVVVVRGGPGTGKSVLAVQLLADGARQGWKVLHATGSKAFQTVLQGKTESFSRVLLKKIFGAQRRADLPVADLFTTFADVAKAGVKDPLSTDLTVCDEAHRLWRHRRIKYPNGMVKWLSDTPMVDEIFRASLVTAFFLDDAQSVRAGEIGRSQLIVDRARENGLKVIEMDLDTQFRCAGSQGYVDWVEALVHDHAGFPLDWRRNNEYEFSLDDDLPKMVARLERLREEGRTARPPATARLVAGYCWKWSKPNGNGALVRDITDSRFGGWSGSWIEKTGQHLKPLDHQYYRWATDESYFDQVGSIYSAQGFEFDHVGVIWGEDLVRRGNAWVAQLEKNKDSAFKKELRQSGEDPVTKLRHVYRVLLTRGMRSTSVFILDPETRDYVAQRLKMVRYDGADWPVRLLNAGQS
jgi:hypothetical protein